MMKVDQEMRVRNDRKYVDYSKQKEFTERLKSIIKEHGWQGFDLVGKDGALAVFLLAQDSDKDLEFQKKCLPMMREAVAKKQSEP